LTSLELFVEKNCMRSHKTTLPGGKHRKSENRVEMAEYWQISPDFRRIYVISRFVDFWVFWRIILGCQCFDKSLNVRRIRKISINLDLNVWFRKSWHSCRAKMFWQISVGLSRNFVWNFTKRLLLVSNHEKSKTTQNVAHDTQNHSILTQEVCFGVLWFLDCFDNSSGL